MADENPGECECCGFRTKKLRLFKNQPTMIAGGGQLTKADFWYCELCCSTHASVSHAYLREGADIMKTICYVGNVLLTEIRKRGGK
jgi:hypothetical protein